MVLEFSVPILAPSLNGSKGLMRMHFHAYRKVRDQWGSLFRLKANHFPRGTFPVKECEVKIVRYYCPHPLDLDNLYASCKIPLDAMRHAGILVEDDPGVVTALDCRQFKVPKKNQIETRITLTMATSTSKGVREATGT